jgi:hypothetical protein
MKLSATGRSLASVLDSAQGSLLLELGPGKLSDKDAAYLPLGSALFAVLNAINPDHKAQTPAGLECAVVQLDVADDIATSTRGIALRTGRINILGSGAVKLRTAEIDVHFKTARRKGVASNVLGLADRFIRLTGTLRHPKVDLNLGGFLKHGGAAWATGGVSLLYDVIATSLTASSNPCETVLQADKD